MNIIDRAKSAGAEVESMEERVRKATAAFMEMAPKFAKVLEVVAAATENLRQEQEKLLFRLEKGNQDEELPEWMTVDLRAASLDQLRKLAQDATGDERDKWERRQGKSCVSAIVAARVSRLRR